MLKKIFITLLISISFISIGGIKKVNAAPNSVTSLSASDYINIAGDYGQDINISKKYAKDSNGKEYLAYCVDQSTLYKESTTCSKKDLDKTTSAKIAAAMSYYGSEPTDEEYYSTQLAIWYLLGGCTTDNSTLQTKDCTNNSTQNTYNKGIKLDFTNPNNSKYNGVVAPFAAKIVNVLNAANKATVNQTPSIKINETSNSFEKKDDYYVTKPIGVTAVNVSQYALSLEDAPEEAIITNESGKTVSTFNSNEKFIVKIPVSSIDPSEKLDFSVKLTATSNKLYESYKYDCIDGQNISLIDYITKNLSDSISLTLSFNSVKISKIDVTNGKELPGATLVLTCPDGSEITWISGDEPHVLYGLDSGEYILTETIAPEGYEIASESVKFTVKEDGTVDGDIVMKNEPEPEQEQLGDSLIIVAWVIAIVGIGYATYYFFGKKNNSIKEKKKSL